jgi:hypothetical protein
VARKTVDARVEIDGVPVEFEDVDPALTADPFPRERPETPVIPYDGSLVEMPLVAIAHGRSGDKGADVNVGVRARHPDFWLVLLRELTAERVGSYLTHLGAWTVQRFELPGIQALNFLLVGGLGAGGTASLRFDPQGKAVAQQLLDMPVAVPDEMSDHPALRG